MNNHDCEMVRMAVMAAADGELPPLPQEAIHEHLQVCSTCREFKAEGLGKLIPSEVSRRQHPVDLWPAIQDQWLSRRLGRPGLARPSRAPAAWLVAACVLMVGGLLTVVWWQTNARRGQSSANRSTSFQEDVATRIYQIPWKLPPPLTTEEFREKYSHYFEPDFQAKQSELLRPDVDVDTLQPVMLNPGDQDGPLGTIFLDQTGAVVLAIAYPFLGSFHEGLATVATKENSRGQLHQYGFVDRTGALVIPAKFESAEPFSEGRAVVRLNGKWGYIDRQGTVVIPARYIMAQEFRDGIARVWKTHDDQQFIDRNGKILFTARHQDTQSFSEGLMYANLASAGKTDNSRRVGYLDRNFNFSIRLGPNSSGFLPLRCEEFHDGMAAVEVEGSNRWGFIDRQGTLAVPGPLPQVQPYSEGLAAVSTSNAVDARWGFIDHAGSFVIAEQFFRVTPFSEGLAAVLLPLESSDSPTAAPGKPALPQVKWGFIDSQGRTVIGPRFYRAKPFKHGLAEVKENPRHLGFIDKQGNYVWQMTIPSAFYPAPPPS